MTYLSEIHILIISATKTDKHGEKGYSNSAYGMSKVGVTVMSIIQAREMAKDTRKDIVINAVSIHALSYDIWYVCKKSCSCMSLSSVFQFSFCQNLPSIQLQEISIQLNNI